MERRAVSNSKMYEEIQEQPEVMARILEEGWKEILSAARGLRETGFRSVMIAARGTSDNAAYYAKYLFEVLLGVPASLASPSVFTIYEGALDLRGTLVIGISQSGESKDVLETIRRSGELGALTLTITNDKGSSMAEVADNHFFLRAGEEESVAATKTYTAELLVLYLLITALKGEESPDEEVRRLPNLARKVLEVEWKGGERYRYAEHLVTTSRGYNLATAQESALKLMETTYVVAEAFSAADLRHGPMAMIGQDFPVLTIVPPGKTRAGMRELVEVLGDREAEVVVVTEDEDLVRQAPSGFQIPFPCPEELSPILYILPLQVFAHELAHLKGLDPDSPRGLSKITETW